MGNMISSEMLVAIKTIARNIPGVVFCGSIGLYLNNKLHRPVGDIDIITQEDWFNPTEAVVNKDMAVTKFIMDNRRIANSTSHKFMVGKDEVSCFKIEVNDIKVDVLHNSATPPTYTEAEIEPGLIIRVETPESAIRAKLGYVMYDQLIHSATKHLKDLIYMDVDKNLIIEAIDASDLLNSREPKKDFELPELPEQSDDLPW